MNITLKRFLPFRAALPTIVVLMFVVLFAVPTTKAEAAGGKVYRSQLYGYSMYPTIKSGEFIYYRTTSVSNIAEGDMVIFQDRRTGERICHRVTAVEDGKLKTKGDNNRFSDRGFVSDSNLLGVVTHVNGKSV